jgi:hypothetical protein
MDYAKEDQPSKRSLYRQRAKQLETEEEFEDENLPEDIAYFHRLFFEIWDYSTGLTYQDLYYWMKIYGVPLSSDVINMLKTISGKANEFVRQKLKDK